MLLVWGPHFSEPQDSELLLSSSADETDSNGTEWVSAVPRALLQFPEQSRGKGDMPVSLGLFGLVKQTTKKWTFQGCTEDSVHVSGELRE